MNKLAEQIAILEEFAKQAEEFLIENGTDYTPDDVIKVASFLIDTTLDAEGEEKVATAYKAGQEASYLFLDDIEKEARFTRRLGDLPGEGVTRGLGRIGRATASINEKYRPVTRYKPIGHNLVEAIAGLRRFMP